MTRHRPNDGLRRHAVMLFCSVALVTALGCPERSSPQGRDAGLAEVGREAMAEVTAAVETQAGATQGGEIPAPRPDTVRRDSVADLPRSTVDATYIAPTGRTIRVAERGNLQSALNSARPGDVVALAPGASYVGSYTLPTKQCGPSGWITVRTDVPDSTLPAPGQRMTPAYAPRLAKLVTRNSTAALRTANPTCGWRIMALEITASPELSRSTVNYGLLLLGDGGWRDGGDVQTTLAKVPSRIVIDRVYLHGQQGTNTVRCLALNSAYTAVVDSWISDCHAKGFDSQAIEGWNGPGPYLIENNFLAGAGENVMFGGADPGIRYLVPSDITIRRNHVYKDPAWKGVWTVKNLFELKNARRVLVEGNVFENNWADAQSGMAIVIKSSHDACGTCTWQGSTDLTFRYNVVRNSPRGFNLQAVDGESDVHVQRVRAEHNLFENIGTFNGTGQDGWLMLLTHDLRDVTIAHNTFVHNSTFGTPLVMDYGEGRARNIVVTDNVFTSPAGYAIFYSGTKVGIESFRAMAGDSWTFARNVVGGMNPEFVPWHPPGNWYVPTAAAIGFVDPSAGDYRLASRSSFKGKARSGSDPGADIGRVRKETAGVVVR